MDSIDRELVNIIQTDFPIHQYPYKILGERLSISEDSVLDRINSLVKAGIIRRIGASFNTKRLGHISVLVAVKVVEDKLEEVAAVISSLPEVTHNYGRNYEYNLWFTLVCESKERTDLIIEDIKNLTGVIDIHKLPAERMFKVKVDFHF